MASGGEEGQLKSEEESTSEPREMLSLRQQTRLELLSKFKKEAIALLLSAVQEGRTQREFEQDYSDFTGKKIPYRELGYDSVDQLVNACPDAIETRSVGQFNAARLFPIINDQVSHLAKLIQQQKPSRVTRIGGVLPISIQRTKVFENIMSILSRKGEYRMLSLTNLREQYSKIYGENVESSVQRLFSRTLGDFLKEEMKFEVNVYERDNQLSVQRKMPGQESWETSLVTRQQQGQWAPQFMQQHWGMPSQPWSMVQMPVFFQQPSTSIPVNFYQFPAHMMVAGNQMGPRPWTPNDMVPPMLMPSFSQMSIPPMMAPQSFFTDPPAAATIEEIVATEEVASTAADEMREAPTIDHVVKAIRTVLATRRNGVHSFDLPKYVCDSLSFNFSPLRLFKLTWYQFLNRYLADEIEILSLSADGDGPSMVEFLVRSKPERTGASVVAADSALPTQQSESEEFLDQIEQELATPPSSDVDWSRDGMDADIEQRRRRVLDNFPEADELMMLLGRVFRQAPVGGILFSDFDNKCRVLGFPLTYSQYGMWGPSDLMDHELISVEPMAANGDGSMLRVFAGRVLQRRSENTVCVPFGLATSMYRLLRAEHSPMVIEQLEALLIADVEREGNVRKEIVQAVVANPRVFNCFVPDLGEGVLRHRLFIRLDDELDDDDIVLLTARRG